MPLSEQINSDLTQALKSRDETTVSTLRMLKSALKNKQIQLQKELEKNDVIAIIQAQIKSRRDSIKMYQKGGREELAQKEEKEIEILKKYLPAQMPEEEIRQKIHKIIAETDAQGLQDMGKVMGKAAETLKGQADMGLVSKIVKEILSK